jgi:nucleotide-binding universal stress UspA family protein
MSYRSILANLNEIANKQAMLTSATVLAHEFDARLIGLYVVPAAPIYPSSSYEPVPDMFEAHRKYFDHQAEAMKTAFEAAVTGIGIRTVLRIEKSPSPLIGDRLIEEGRSFDMILVSQTEAASQLGVELDFVPRVAVAAGRPVVVVPFNCPVGSIPETVVVGWNGSREAARAVFDSLPFLKRAREVHVVWVDPSVKRREMDALPGEGIARSLELHGVKVVMDPVDGDDHRAGDVLMKRVADLRAGLLVIGAYGRPRLSEYILGGVTRTVLRKMRCPVFLSH